MKQESITAWAFFLTGMMITETLGILLRQFNYDKYSPWIALFIYSFGMIYLSIKKDKSGEEDGN